MTFSTLAVTLTPPFAYVTLNRPEVKNAMNAQMILDLIAAFEGLKDNHAIRAVILSGAGGTFCAGGDIKELAETFQGSRIDADPSAVDRMLHAVNQAPQVVIAKVEGAAMGGGLGLVCVSDIAYASADAIFGLPEVRLGLAPAQISPFVIARLGLTRARELMLTGRRFSGEKAKEYGLVHEAYFPSDLDGHMANLLDEIRQCSPNALAACKRLIFEVAGKTPDSTLDFRVNLLNELRRSDQGTEGMMAFVERRKPRWVEEKLNHRDTEDTQEIL
jgi:isohexenylglutaconyl-CoA hydratase